MLGNANIEHVRREQLPGKLSLKVSPAFCQSALKSLVTLKKCFLGRLETRRMNLKACSATKRIRKYWAPDVLMSYEEQSAEIEKHFCKFIFCEKLDKRSKFSNQSTFYSLRYYFFLKHFWNFWKNEQACKGELLIEGNCWTDHVSNWLVKHQKRLIIFCFLNSFVDSFKKID